MPTRITAHGITANSDRYNGKRIWRLSSPAGQEGIVIQTDRRCWEHFGDMDAVHRGWGQGRGHSLDIIMESVGRNYRDGISIAQIDAFHAEHKLIQTSMERKAMTADRDIEQINRIVLDVELGHWPNKDTAAHCLAEIEERRPDLGEAVDRALEQIYARAAA